MKHILVSVLGFALLMSSFAPPGLANGWVKKATDEVYLMDLDYVLKKNLSIGIAVGGPNGERGITVTYFKTGPLGGHYVTEPGARFEACYQRVRVDREGKLKNFMIRAEVPDFVAHDLGQKKTNLTITLFGTISHNPDYPEDDFRRLSTQIDMVGNYGKTHIELKDEQTVSPKIFELTKKLQEAKACK